MDQGEGVEGAALKRDPLDFALWKAQKPGEDTAWDAPWGRGRPGWHIECSAMAESLLGVDFEIHGGGADLLFPHHENEEAQTCAARKLPLARLWVHNGMVRTNSEKMSKSLGNTFLLHAALDALRPGRADRLLLRRPLPPADRFRRRATRGCPAQPWRGSVSRVIASSAVSSPAWSGPLRERFFAALARDFNTPAGAGRRCLTGCREANRSGEPVGDADLREMLQVLALDNLLDVDGGDCSCRRRRRCWPSARLRAPLATGPAPTSSGSALREQGWEVRDGPAGAELRPIDSAPMIVYGRNAVHEAIRGPRTVAHVWATQDAAREPWLSGGGAPAVSVVELRRGDRAALRLRRTSGHLRRGVRIQVSWTRRPCSRWMQPLLVALDQVQDPQNLGAICRSAECAGAAGLVLPERRAAEVTPAVCKASAGAVEHLPIAQVRNLSDFLADAKARGIWCYGADGEASHRLPQGRFQRPGRAGAGLGGQRVAPAGRRSLRRARLAAAAGPDRVAERRRGGGRAAVRGRRAALSIATGWSRANGVRAKSPHLA